MRRRKIGTKKILVLALFSPSVICALPQGGNIKYGRATLNYQDSKLTVNQSSQKLIVNWQSFNISQGETVRFNQPSSSAIALNRVIGADPTYIYGLLSANGNVWVINPNGVVVGKTGKIDTHGFLASTLNIKDEDFINGNYKFFKVKEGGFVVNEGKINVKSYAVTIAPEVRNNGIIDSQGGKVYLLSGDEVILAFDNSGGLIGYQISKGTAEAIGITNEGTLKGHQIVLNAKSLDKVYKDIVNTKGVVEAVKVVNEGGVIKIVAENGNVNVGGTLKAENGFIETSGDTVKVEKETTITAKKWLIDPTDITIDDAMAQAIESQLQSGDVEVKTKDEGSDEGNIIVNAPITWSANTLTLTAHNDILVNSVLTAKDNAKLSLNYGGDLLMKLTPDGFVGRIDFPGRSGTGFLKIHGYDFYVIKDVNELQNIKNNLIGLYALGSDIDASVTKTWNDGKGFEPIGDYSNPFDGVIEGLGHKITGLYINRPNQDYIGLLGRINSNTKISNVGLENLEIKGQDDIGGLVGNNVGGIIQNSYATGSVNGYNYIGGLVGRNDGTIQNSYATDFVNGNSYVGGLVGLNYEGTIQGSYAMGSVNGDHHVGGLVGLNYEGTIQGSYAMGSVNGNNYVGGLVGLNYEGTIENSYYNIDKVLINGKHVVTVGGIYDYQFKDWLNNGKTLYPNAYLVKDAQGFYLIQDKQDFKDILAFVYDGTLKFKLAKNFNLSDFSNWYIPYLAGTLDGDGHFIENLAINAKEVSAVGFIGTNTGAIKNIGLINISVNGYDGVGGLVGWNDKGTIQNSYVTGSVSGNGAVGSLVGRNDGTIENSYTTGSVNGDGDVGGLVGFNYEGTIQNSYATGSVDGNIYVGGLVGNNDGGTIQNSFWDIDTSGINTSEGGFGLHTEDMKKLATFKNAGWDISDKSDENTVWRIYEGESYPVLRIFQKKVIVKANDVTKVYDGQPFYGGNGYTIVKYLNAPIKGTPVYGGNSQGAKDVGTYTITVSGLTLDRKTQLDYQIWGDIVYQPGTLKINPRPITLVGYKRFDGTPIFGANEFRISNLVEGETLNLSGYAIASSILPGLYSQKYGSLKSFLKLLDGTGKVSNYFVKDIIGIIDFPLILPNTIRQITLNKSIGDTGTVKNLVSQPNVKFNRAKRVYIRISQNCVKGSKCNSNLISF